MSIGSIGSILMNELDMKWVVAKFVTKSLTEDQTENRLKCVWERNFFIKSIITGDKIQVFEYNSKTSLIIVWKILVKKTKKNTEKN